MALGEATRNASVMVAVFAAIFIFLPWVVLSFVKSHNDRAVSSEYAHSYFEGLVPIDTVYESREFHPFGSNWGKWDCTFAVAQLSEKAPKVPPVRQTHQASIVSSDFRFGGDWVQTPVAELSENTRDAFEFCSKYFDEETVSKLRNALTQPGSWYVRSEVGELLYIYSIPQNIAARIRFGD